MATGFMGWVKRYAAVLGALSLTGAVIASIWGSSYRIVSRMDRIDRNQRMIATAMLYADESPFRQKILAAIMDGRDASLFVPYVKPTPKESGQ